MLGNLALLLAASMLVPLVVALADRRCVSSLGASVGLAAGVGLALGPGPRWAQLLVCRVLRGGRWREPPGGHAENRRSLHAPAREAGEELRARDAFVTVTLGWLLAGVLGATPFVLEGVLGPVDALFESISGFTTTGATVLTRVEELPAALLLWRSMLQWLGGMGIIVLFISVMQRPGAGGAHLFRAEFPGPMPEKLLPRITATARMLWGLYASVTLAAALAYWATGLSLFDAVNHAFTTLSTGGFSTRSAGVWRDPRTEVVATLFMFVGGMSFALQYRLYRLRDWGSLRNASEFWVYLSVAGVATLLVTAATLAAGVYQDPGTAIRKAAFQVVSLLSTTGFTSADYGAWPPLAGAVLFTVMFVGGMTASTGGGPKVLRWMVMLKQSALELVKLLHPRSVQLLRLGGQVVSEPVVIEIGTFLVIYMAAWFGGFIILAATGLDLISAASGAIACLGNIGPGFASVGPTGNYAHLSDIAKVVLSLLMVVGRLELYAVLAALHPEFWRHR